MRIAFTHNLRHNTTDEAQAEFDSPATVEMVCEGLRSAGHEVFAVDVGGGTLSSITARLEGLRPDLVFNTAEGSRGRFREALWPALFDGLGFPHTGADAWACAVTLDKQLTKLLVREAGVPTPGWKLVTNAAHIETCSALRFPVIAKPNAEGSSKGITERSVVDDMDGLRTLLGELLESYPSGILVEEFIVGRDVVVPWLEGISPETGGVLPACAYHFDPAVVAGRRHVIYDYTLKGELSHAVEVTCPAPLPVEVAAELQRLSAVVYATLGLRDFGRIDWRVADDGSITFIEVNALPSLESGAGIYLAAALVGLTNEAAVLNAIVDNATKRHGLNAATKDATLKVGLTYNLKRTTAKSESDDDRDAEYDAQSTIDGIAEAIERQGHRVVRLEATPDLARTLSSADINLVFNVAEGARGRGREAHVPAMLEMLGIPYTGSDASTMAVALDKDLAKRVVSGAGVPVPKGRLLRGDEPSEIFADLVFPLIAKPNAEGSSKGVLGNCVVDDEAGLRALVGGLYARYRQPILVEEFLPGREFTVGILTNDDGTPDILPPMEIVFLKPGTKQVYAFEDKLDWSKTLRYDRPAVIDDDLRKRIDEVVLGAWRALGCRDVARIDLRCDALGQPRFIEVNPLPGLSPGWSDLCLIADSMDLSYDGLIARILAPAISRFRTGNP